MAQGFMALFRMLSLSALPLPQPQLISRLLRSTFASTTHWSNYDPFFRQKDEAFKSSKNGVLEIAGRFREYAMALRQRSVAETPAQQKVVFVNHLLPFRISESC